MDKQLKYNNPFKTPENYFQKFEDDMASHARLPDVKEEFRVPENYFEDMQNSVLKASETTKVVSIKTWMSVAASLVVLVCAVTWLLPTTGNSVDLQYVELSEYDTSDLLEMISDDISVEQLAILIEDDYLQDLTIDGTEEDFEEVLENIELIDLENLL